MSTGATEYYGYLLSIGYNPQQLEQFELICDRVNKGELTMNQSFKKAKNAGFTNSNGEAAPSSLQEWIQTAQQAGWIDKGLDALNQAIKNKGQGSTSVYVPPTPPPQKPQTMKWVLLSVALLGAGVGIYYLATKKKN